MIINNLILKKISIALQLQHEDIINILALVGKRISLNELENIMKNWNDPSFRPLNDDLIKAFLNGLIIYKRGPIRENKIQERKN